MRDQHGGRWIRFGTPQHAIWFAVADLISDSSRVFRGLSSTGASYLTAASQTGLKRRVEAQADYREALVATRPGWLEKFYVFGDGGVVRPCSDDREVIVAFELNSKFIPRGTLAEWQLAVGPFVAEQPLPFFVIGLALVGPLLRFAPPDYLNPQVEIVGRGETGKTTAGVVAASVWAGNPGSGCGGGESWDMTLNAVDDLKLAHRDGFVFADEGNLAGATTRDRRDFARQVVFKVATTGGKRRLGDPVSGEHARLALLSTTNTALGDLIEDTEEVADAAQSRMITIRVGTAALEGVFEKVPVGHVTAEAASEALRAAVDEYWGAAGREFVTRVMREIEIDDGPFRKYLAERLARYRGLVGPATAPARIQKTFALVAVAAHLAQRWGILLQRWGSPKQMTRAIARAAITNAAPDIGAPLAEVQAYVERHRSSLVQIDRLSHPLSKGNFEAHSGFLRQTSRGLEVLIPASRFQAEFPNQEDLMRKLRKAGLAQTECGRTPKMTIKTPRKICASGRVYCIRISPVSTAG